MLSATPKFDSKQDNFSVLDRSQKSSPKILKNNTTSQNITIFVYHIDQLSCTENLKEFYFGPKIEWSVLTRTAS